MVEVPEVTSDVVEVPEVEAVMQAWLVFRIRSRFAMCGTAA